MVHILCAAKRAQDHHRPTPASLQSFGTNRRTLGCNEGKEKKTPYMHAPCRPSYPECNQCSSPAQLDTMPRRVIRSLEPDGETCQPKERRRKCGVVIAMGVRLSRTPGIVLMLSCILRYSAKTAVVRVLPMMSSKGKSQVHKMRVLEGRADKGKKSLDAIKCIRKARAVLRQKS